MERAGLQKRDIRKVREIQDPDEEGRIDLHDDGSGQLRKDRGPI